MRYLHASVRVCDEGMSDSSRELELSRRLARANTTGKFTQLLSAERLLHKDRKGGGLFVPFYPSHSREVSVFIYLFIVPLTGAQSVTHARGPRQERHTQALHTHIETEVVLETSLRICYLPSSCHPLYCSQHRAERGRRAPTLREAASRRRQRALPTAKILYVLRASRIATCAGRRAGAGAAR